MVGTRPTGSEVFEVVKNGEIALNSASAVRFRTLATTSSNSGRGRTTHRRSTLAPQESKAQTEPRMP